MALPALKDLFPEHFFQNPDLTAPPPPQSIVNEPSAGPSSSSPANAGLTTSTQTATATSSVLRPEDANVNDSNYQPQPQVHSQSYPQSPTRVKGGDKPPSAFLLSQVRPRAVAKRNYETAREVEFEGFDVPLGYAKDPRDIDLTGTMENGMHPPGFLLDYSQYGQYGQSSNLEGGYGGRKGRDTYGPQGDPYPPDSRNSNDGPMNEGGSGSGRDVTRSFNPPSHHSRPGHNRTRHGGSGSVFKSSNVNKRQSCVQDDDEVSSGEEDGNSLSGDHDNEKRRHPCPRCGKRFNRPSSLKIHLNTHTGDKPFECPFPGCGRSFNVSSNMRRHYRNHSRRDTPPPLPANAYPVVGRDPMMNDQFPQTRNGTDNDAYSKHNAQEGFGPYGRMHPGQYMNFGYMNGYMSGYMGMGGGMNGMGMGMNGVNGVNGMGGGIGMGGGMGGGMSPHPGMHRGEMGMHPGMVHPGMGMYPGMGMHPGMMGMGMGMSPNGMNGMAGMGMGYGMGAGGGTGGQSPVGWYPPVSNTRGEKTDGNGTKKDSKEHSAHETGRAEHGQSRHGDSPGPNGCLGGGRPADPPTPPYTNEPPSPPVLHSGPVWDDVEQDRDEAERTKPESDGRGGDGEPPKKRTRVECEGDKPSPTKDDDKDGEGEEATSTAIGYVERGGPELNNGTNTGEKTKSGSYVTTGTTSSGNNSKDSKAPIKKDVVCQPSPETPSMRDLNDVVPEENVNGSHNKYRHAESHMRQSSITDAPLSHSLPRSEAHSTPHPHSRPVSSSGPPIAYSRANPKLVKSDERNHASYPSGRIASEDVKDQEDDNFTHSLFAPPMGQMPMPFPCYTFPPPMPGPLGMGSMNNLPHSGMGTGMGMGRGMGSMNGVGGMGPMGVMGGMPSIPIEPPMAGLGPPPPGEGDPPPLGSSLDRSICIPTGKRTKTGLSVCPPHPGFEGKLVPYPPGTAPTTSMEDIDPSLR